MKIGISLFITVHNLHQELYQRCSKLIRVRKLTQVLIRPHKARHKELKERMLLAVLRLVIAMAKLVQAELMLIYINKYHNIRNINKLPLNILNMSLSNNITLAAVVLAIPLSHKRSDYWLRYNPSAIW